MNLEKLFEMQKALDERIVKDKGLEGQDLLDKKILALQVELGELANELPEVFKFWSNKKNDMNKALKEYVDGLHFILSIGLELKIKGVYLIDEMETKDITKTFNTLFGYVSDLNRAITESDLESTYNWLFAEFVDLGKLLGFTLEQIEKAYIEKNQTNHERQANGY